MTSQKHDRARRGECRRVRDLLVLWVAGELDDEETARVERHIAECAKCAEIAAGYRRTADALRQAFAASPSRELSAEARRRVEDAMAAARSGRATTARDRRARFLLVWSRRVVTAAAVIMVLFGGVHLLFRRRTERVAAPPEGMRVLHVATTQEPGDVTESSSGGRRQGRTRAALEQSPGMASSAVVSKAEAETKQEVAEILSDRKSVSRVQKPLPTVVPSGAGAGMAARSQKRLAEAARKERDRAWEGTGKRAKSPGARAPALTKAKPERASPAEETGKVKKPIAMRKGMEPAARTVPERRLYERGKGAAGGTAANGMRRRMLGMGASGGGGRGRGRAGTAPKAPVPELAARWKAPQAPAAGREGKAPQMTEMPGEPEVVGAAVAAGAPRGFPPELLSGWSAVTKQAYGQTTGEAGKGRRRQFAGWTKTGREAVFRLRPSMVPDAWPEEAGRWFGIFRDLPEEWLSRRAEFAIPEDNRGEPAGAAGLPGIHMYGVHGASRFLPDYGIVLFRIVIGQEALAAPRDDAGVHFIVAVDTSGSMAAGRRLAAVRAFLDRLKRSMRRQDVASVIIAGLSPKVVFRTVGPDQLDAGEIPLAPRGLIDLREALRAACELRTTDRRLARLLLITDGAEEEDDPVFAECAKFLKKAPGGPCVLDGVLLPGRPEAGERLGQLVTATSGVLFVADDAPTAASCAAAWAGWIQDGLSRIRLHVRCDPKYVRRIRPPAARYDLVMRAAERPGTGRRWSGSMLLYLDSRGEGADDAFTGIRASIEDAAGGRTIDLPIRWLDSEAARRALTAADRFGGSLFNRTR